MRTSEDPEQLTAAQLSKLRERLLAERAHLQGSEGNMAPVREAQERSADEMDEAEASIVQHEAIGRAAHDRSHLAEVERALQKIKAGTYGVSELSGEPIGYARLDAVPWARFTAAEQEDLEREQRR
ncbi:MAG TPA: TraR/DksA family transcriptional regulator [Polyangiaceae bacterium]|nr:TraR/DksA family transcriptional regulator [Polyangiaceae bacterium]